MSEQKPRVCIIILATRTYDSFVKDGTYYTFIKDLVESIGLFFLTDCYKDVLILTNDAHPSVIPLTENCVVHCRNCKAVNKASYIFELMLDNLDLISQADFCYKMDADMLVYREVVGAEILPASPCNFSIINHFAFDHAAVAKDRPKTFSADIPLEYQTGPYWQTCLFGGRLPNMVAMAQQLDAMIQLDRSRKTMWGAWEEPYVNYYLALRQAEVRTLSPAYAAPLYWYRLTEAYRARYLKSVDIPEKIFHFNHMAQFGSHEIG